MIRESLVVALYLLLVGFNNTNAGVTGGDTQIRTSSLKTLNSLGKDLFIPGDEIKDKSQLQLIRCMNRLSRLGGQLFWFSERRAYMDNLYICTNNKLLLR